MATNHAPHDNTTSGPPRAGPTAHLDASVTAVLNVSHLLLAITARAMATVSDSTTPSQLRLMMYLHHGGPRTAGGLARGLRVHSSTVTRTVGKLVRAGLVTRKVDRNQRRGTSIVLTHGGQNVVDAVLRQRHIEIARTVSRMTASDRQALQRALSTFEQGARSAASSRHTATAQRSAHVHRHDAGHEQRIASQRLVVEAAR